MTGNLNNQSLVVVRSVTQAMSGQKILSQNGIHATLERDASPHLHNGCGYGLRVGEGKVLRAVELLRRSGIEVVRVT